MVLLYKGDVSGDTNPQPNFSEDDLDETLVTWIGDGGVATQYLIPTASVTLYYPANGLILGLDELADEDERRALLVQHFALMVGQEPCFLQCVPTFVEFAANAASGPSVDDTEGGKACGAPWKRWTLPADALKKGTLKNTSAVLVMGWLL